MRDSYAESKVKELAQRRLEHTVKTEQGDLLFSINYSWTMQRILANETAETVCSKLDRFVTAQTGWIS